MKILKLWLLATLSLFYSISMFSMDTPEYKATDNKVYVLTADEQLIKVPLWQIKEMKVLLILLEHQKGDNNQQNPIKATMLNSQELTNLIKALHSIAEGKFNEFYEELAISDNALLEKNHGKQILSLENGSIRKLINAAERIQASGLSAFCLSKNLPMDLQKRELVPLLIDPCINLLTAEKNIKKTDHVSTIAFNSDGTKIVTDSGINLALYDIGSFEKVTHQNLYGHKDPIKKVIFSPDGKKILSCSMGEEYNLILWDIKNPKNITSYVLVGHDNEINDIVFSANGENIISCSEGDGPTLIIWNIKNPAEITYRVLISNQEVAGAAISSDGMKIAWANKDEEELHFYDFKSKNEQILDGHNANSIVVIFSPDGTKIASPGDESILNLWDVKDSNNIKHLSLHGHNGMIETIAFSPDSKKMISGSSGGGYNLILWDMSDEKEIIHYALEGHDNTVRWAAFGGNKVASVGDNASANENKEDSLVVWDISNSNDISPIFFTENNIATVAFSSNGNKIAIVNSEQLILFYFLTAEEIKVLNDCNFIQAQLIYELCLASQRKKPVSLNSPYMKKVYESLSFQIKQLLQRALGISIVQ